MKYIKRFLVTVLVMMISLSSIITSYAEFNGGGSGGSWQVSTLENIGTIHLYHVNQGFRVYLVNEKGLSVSNTADFVKYLPWKMSDFAFSQSFEEMSKAWNEYYNVTGLWNIPKTKIIYTGGVKTDSYYTQATGNINRDGSQPSTRTGVNYITRERQSDTLASYGDMMVSPGKMYTIANLYIALKNAIEADYGAGSFKLTGTSKLIPYTSPITGEELYTYDRIVAPIEGLYENGGITATGDEMRNLMMMPLSKDFNVDDAIVIRYLISMALPNMDGMGNLKDGGALTPLFHFTDSEVSAKYEEVYQSASTDKEKKDALINTMRELNLKVAFEPVSWAVPSVTSTVLPSMVPGNKWNYTWTADSIVYGTPTSIIAYVSAEFKEDYKEAYTDCGIPENNDTYCSWMRDNDVNLDWNWGLPQYAYHLTSDQPEYGLQAYNKDEIGPGDLGSLFRGVHTLGNGVMYFSVDLEDDRVHTSTWDREVYPEDNYSPGPAPEPPVTEEGDEYKEKDHKFNIIKFYGEKQPDNSIIYTENHTRENTVHNISINDEVDYKVENWFTSPEYREPNSDTDSYDDYKASLPNGQNGNESGHVIIKSDSADTALYVKLIKEKEIEVPEDLGNAKIILHEDELSYPYSMEDLRGSLDEIWFNFPDKSHNGSGSHDGGEDEEDWECSWSRVLDDSSYHMTLKNGFDYGSTNFIGSQGIFAGIEGGKVNSSNSERSASIDGFTTEHLVPNWKFVLYRDKSKDKVTLYPNKNSSQVISDLSLIGIDSTSYIPGNRIAKEGAGNFKNTFSIKYIYESVDKTLSWTSTGCSEHGDDGSYSGSENMYIDMFNASYNVADNTLTKYYLGKANTGNVQPANTNSPFNLFGKTYKVNCNVFQKNGVIKFYPMVKMTYQTLGGGEQGVYVTSTNESLVLAPTRVETGFFRSLNGKPNLNLDSTQWSTHAKTQSFLTAEGIADKNSVLPGGALYSLDADSESRETWLGIRCWQTVVEDSQLESLIEKEGVKNRSQADVDWDNFKSTSKNVLEHYQIVQYAAPGIHKNLQDFNKASGKALVSGAGQVNQFGGNTLDRSGKYYLKVDGTGADRADIDIINEQEQVIVYKVLSDVNGNVFVLRDGMEIGRISKTQGAGSILEIPEIKELDDKTKIITNYISGIDRNKGSDRDSQTWYNEAFDGIEIIYRQWAVQLGFGNGQDARSSVLDTKLTGKLEDRRDLYNFDEGSLADKTRTSQFKTSARSTDGSANGKANGYIGSLDGMDIRNNMAASMYSKLFYIPNANVTDLN